MQQGLSANAIKRIERAHLDQLALCKALESIADSLPDGLDGRVCSEAARTLGPVTTGAHALDEEILFPVLAQSDLMHFDFGPTIERLRLEHYEDECFAEELRDALVLCAQSDPPHSAEAMGYMLRGFFESVRRHIAFERELLESIIRASNVKPQS